MHTKIILPYYTGAAAQCCTEYGRENLQIHYANVACNGSEYSLASCDKTYGNRYCYRDEVASVTCYPGEVMIIQCSPTLDSMYFLSLHVGDLCLLNDSTQLLGL